MSRLLPRYLSLTYSNSQPFQERTERSIPCNTRCEEKIQSIASALEKLGKETPLEEAGRNFVLFYPKYWDKECECIPQHVDSLLSNFKNPEQKSVVWQGARPAGTIYGAIENHGREPKKRHIIKITEACDLLVQFWRAVQR